MNDTPPKKKARGIITIRINDFDLKIEGSQDADAVISAGNVCEALGSIRRLAFEQHLNKEFNKKRVTYIG